MAEGELLSRAFAEAHPEEAARVLEGLSAADMADFVGQQPAAVAAPVLAALLPLPAAGLLDSLPDEQAAGLLADLGPERAAAILRCLQAPRREALLGRLRPGRRAALALLLAYPGDTVGAWADPRALAVRRDSTVGWARRAVADSGAPANCDLYVVDGDRRLAGAVAVGKLLRSDPASALDRVMDRQPPALPAAAGVGEARGAPEWSGRGALPVVDARGRLLGAVSAETLERAVGAVGQRDLRPTSGALTVLIGTYLQAASGLLRGYWGLLAPAGRQHGEDRS
jgi:Mg/Co/Ni transporter MgtE